MSKYCQAAVPKLRVIKVSYNICVYDPQMFFLSVYICNVVGNIHTHSLVPLVQLKSEIIHFSPVLLKVRCGIIFLLLNQTIQNEVHTVEVPI